MYSGDWVTMTTNYTRKLLNNRIKKHKLNLLQITVSNIPKLLIKVVTWRGKEDCYWLQNGIRYSITLHMFAL